MGYRYYTPDEVNRLIPELERIIAYLRRLDAEIHEKDWHLKQLKVEAHRRDDKVDTYTFLKDEAELDFLRILSQGQCDRIRELGGEVKAGYLVDFPARIGGEDVLLCWRPGEEAVAWYHGLHEGMMGRKPLPMKPTGEFDESGE
jgi:hypothetical protein